MPGIAWQSTQQLMDEWGLDGCDIHPACLTCPLPVCRFDAPTHWAKTWLLAQKVTRLRDTGITVEAIAEQLSISKRSVFRNYAWWLKNANGPAPPSAKRRPKPQPLPITER